MFLDFSNTSVSHVTNIVGGGGALTVIVALDARVGGGVAHRGSCQRGARRVLRALHAAHSDRVAYGRVCQGGALGGLCALCNRQFILVVHLMLLIRSPDVRLCQI